MRNEHHDFEQLCFYLSKARICSNIIPSTGPVSAGGDKGKDFQTFTTYLTGTDIKDSTFIGLASKKPIVFACSLQKKGLEGKIKSDIEKIARNSPKIELERIYFFCTEDINVATSEDLKKWSLDEFKTPLEIINGQAISNMLIDSDVFWIAVQYLHILAELYPRSETEPTWYSQAFAYWKTGNEPKNYADFFDIKLAARYSTEETSARQDLPIWIDLLRKFTTGSFPTSLQRSAIYEIVVASLNGLGTLTSLEKSLQGFFADIPKLQRIEELEDAVTLLNFSIIAFRKGVVQLKAAEISAWQKQLTSKVIERLHEARSSNQKCPLLEIRGLQSLQINLETGEKPSWDEAIKWWTRMIDIADEAPLFPLDRFSNRLTKSTPYISHCEGYDYLVSQTDSLLAKRLGETGSAEKSRDRAIEFLKMEKPLDAINQLHKAKVQWFKEETMDGSIICMMVIAQAYKLMGLMFAAKYYALAAASISVNSPNGKIKQLTPKALAIVADCDYEMGSWASFSEIVKLHLNANSEFSKHESNDDPTVESQQIVLGLASFYAIGRLLSPELEQLLEKFKTDLKLPDWLLQLLDEAYSSWKKNSLDEIWEKIQQQLWGRPFGDIGDKRTVTWSELGITWNVNWSNDYDTTASVEKFIAALQIFLADISNEELVLLKTEITINLSYEETPVKKMGRIPTNKGREWNVSFPRTYGTNIGWQEQQSDLLYAVMVILNEVSLLPHEKFMEILEGRFKDGLSTKAFVAKPYDTLYKEAYPKSLMESLRALKIAVPESQRPFKIRENPALSWKGGPGPGYDKTTLKELLNRRYTRSLIPIERTIQELRKDSHFRETIEKLRKEGWLDWQILNSIANIAVSYRIRQKLGPSASAEEAKKLFIELHTVPESAETQPVPSAEFSEENIRNGFQLLMASNIQGLGLELRQRCPDFEGIAHLLRNRYMYWIDDIPHDDPFLDSCKKKDLAKAE